MTGMMNRFLAALSIVAVCSMFARPDAAVAQDQTAQIQQAEVQIGQQFYQSLRQKGLIIKGSPDDAVLNPIAEHIKRIADPQYFRPFTFILVHQSQPNAFAVPGGNVYVTDSLMRFVENADELAGVLCHETSHDINHDVVNNMIKDQRAQRNATIVANIANFLTAGTITNFIAGSADLELGLRVQHFSRQVETAADLKGADTCARAGVDPWGMIWLFQRFEKASSGGQLEVLSDHPTDEKRITALRAHFRANPNLFASFSPDISTATRLNH